MNRTVLITGASTGIGAETARELAEGNRIFVHYNASKAEGQKTARDVQARGGEALLAQADLSTEKGCRTLFEEVSRHTDRLDVLVNNAGGLIRRMPARELDWSLMEQTFALNVFSALMVSRLFIPLLDKRPLHREHLVDRHPHRGPLGHDLRRGQGGGRRLHPRAGQGTGPRHPGERGGPRLHPDPLP
jgi:NAD(P)-dependent dehydrogenase (short-subunit alcohol dehydrogenase family)